MITDRDLIELWREAVVRRAHGKCEYPHCAATSSLHAHHFFSRKNYSIRYDVDNGICLCCDHHLVAHGCSDFRATIIAHGVRTEEWLKNLINKRNKIIKNNVAYKEECKKILLEVLHGKA